MTQPRLRATKHVHDIFSWMSQRGIVRTSGVWKVPQTVFQASSPLYRLLRLLRLLSSLSPALQANSRAFGRTIYGML